MSDAIEPHKTLDRRNPWLVSIAITLVALAVFGYALNWTKPWESDQSAKAAQIMEIAEANDYFLSDNLPDYYRLRLFSLYFAASAAFYKALGIPIFTFMNLSSVVMGTLTLLALAFALRNAMGIHPLWSACVFLAMPLFITTSTYGNEVNWSFAFFCLSLWFLSTNDTRLRCGGAAAFACCIFCRADMILMVPFWAAWAVLFGPAITSRSDLLRRLVPLGVVFSATAGLLWLAFVRTIPQTKTSFEWDTNWNLLASFMSYPFNPSVVLIGAIGWLLLCRVKLGYALSHLLLLASLLFYLHNLSSPKYIMVMILFYGLPAAFLLQRSGPRLRPCFLSAIFFWAIFGVSPFGVFGPDQASIWIVPTADGPTPIGGYFEFFRRARQGFYQSKQVEYLEVTSNSVIAAQNLAPDVRLALPFSSITLPYTLVSLRLERGDKELRLPPFAKPDDTKLLMVRFGYFAAEYSTPGQYGKIRAFLEKGQVRAIATVDQPFPDVIELGEQVPENNDLNLAKRIIFMAEYYHGRKAFHLPEFVEAYRATCWIPIDQASQVPPGIKPIYQDDQFLGFDREIGGGQLFGYPWPARYYNFKLPSRNI